MRKIEKGPSFYEDRSFGTDEKIFCNFSFYAPFLFWREFLRAFNSHDSLMLVALPVYVCSVKKNMRKHKFILWLRGA